MGFEACHPGINLIYFVSVISCLCCFDNPIFIAISFFSALLYGLKRKGIKMLIFAILLIALSAGFALYYSTYTHFGITVLARNSIGNNITLESLIYGAARAIILSALLIWLSCLYSVFSSDKVVYLFGRLSPRLSIIISMLLRMFPRLKHDAICINNAQKGIGRGINQGNIFQRSVNLIRIISILITRTIDYFAAASESMKSRGNSLRGRTAFSIYRFDNRDRSYVTVTFVALTVTAMAWLLEQTTAVYDPRIIMPPSMPLSYVFYIFYGVLCLMPLALELWTEYRFKRSIK